MPSPASEGHAVALDSEGTSKQDIISWYPPSPQSKERRQRFFRDAELHLSSQRSPPSAPSSFGAGYSPLSDTSSPSGQFSPPKEAGILSKPEKSNFSSSVEAFEGGSMEPESKARYFTTNLIQSNSAHKDAVVDETSQSLIVKLETSRSSYNTIKSIQSQPEPDKEHFTTSNDGTSSHSPAFMSDEEVVNFRNALHDDESPALTQDGQIIRNPKKASSSYFSNLNIGRNSPAIQGAGKHSFSMSAGPTNQFTAGSLNLSTSYNSRAAQSSPDIFKLASGNPFVDHKTATAEVKLNIRGGNGEGNDSESVSAQTSTSKTSQRTKKSQQTLKNKESEATVVGEDSEATEAKPETKPEKDTLGETMAQVAASIAKHDLQTTHTPTKPSNKGKGRATTIHPPSSDADSTTDSDSQATLPPFNAQNLLARHTATQNALDEEAAQVAKKQQGLVEIMKIWMQVAQAKENQRANERINARIAELEKAEESLRKKEKHRKCLISFNLLYAEDLLY